MQTYLYFVGTNDINNKQSVPSQFSARPARVVSRPLSSYVHKPINSGGINPFPSRNEVAFDKRVLGCCIILFVIVQQATSLSATRVCSLDATECRSKVA